MIFILLPSHSRPLIHDFLILFLANYDLNNHVLNLQSRLESNGEVVSLEVLVHLFEQVVGRVERPEASLVLLDYRAESVLEIVCLVHEDDGLTRRVVPLDHFENSAILTEFRLVLRELEQAWDFHDVGAGDGVDLSLLQLAELVVEALHALVSDGCVVLVLLELPVGPA